MNAMPPATPTPVTQTTTAPAKERIVKEQVVLVLQGGGALGAYQAGVYQALMEGGIEPDWVIGTSIGAINGALIAGNEPANRIARLREFWDGVGARQPLDQFWPASSIFGNSFANLSTLMSGVPGFFTPNPQAFLGPTFPLGVEKRIVLHDRSAKGRRSGGWSISIASPQRTSGFRLARSTCAPAKCAISTSSHAALCRAHHGVWRAAAGVSRRHNRWRVLLGRRHLFEYADRGRPRRRAAPQLADLLGQRVATRRRASDEIQQVMARHKDIQFASRGKSHVGRQAQLHRLRHVVRELVNHMPPELRADPVVQDLAEYGCGTLMHLVRLLSPRLDGEDHTKDIDFTRSGIESRWKAGYEHASKVLARSRGKARPIPWPGS